MATHPYQLVLLGPSRDKYTPALRQRIEELFADTGLDFASDGQLLVGAAVAPDWGGFPTAIWFGTEGLRSSTVRAPRNATRRCK
jgi:hypothetical protein